VVKDLMNKQLQFLQEKEIISIGYKSAEIHSIPGLPPEVPVTARETKQL